MRLGSREFEVLFWADLGPLDLVDWAGEEGGEFDIEAVVIYLRALGMGGVRFCPFDASLRALYLSSLTPPSPLGTGVVERALSVCKKQEIHFSLILPVGAAGDWLAERHPEWLSSPSHDINLPQGLRPFCPANEGYRDFLLALASELVEAFSPLSIFFKAVPFKFCVCHRCRKMFEEGGFLSLPEEPLSELSMHALGAYLSLRRAQWEQVAADLSLRLKERHPGLSVGFSREGPWEAGLPLFPLDVPAEGIEGSDSLPPANIGRLVLRPLRLRTPEGLFGKAGADLRAELIKVLAAGEMPFLSEALALFYDCSPGEALRALFEFVKERMPLGLGRNPVPHVAVLASEVSLAFCCEEGRYCETKERALETLSGLFDLLWATSIPFVVLPVERVDADTLGAFPLVLLPSTSYIPKASQEALRDYLDDGGAVLSFFEVGLFDEEGHKPDSFVADVIGCTRVDTCYYGDASMGGGVEFPPGHFLTFNLPQRPIASRMGAYLPVSAAVRVDPLGSGIGILRQPPVLERGVSQGPRMGDRTSFPALVISEIGPGRTAYLCFNIGREYFLRRQPCYRQFFANLIHWLSPPEFEVRGSESVRGAMWQLERGVIVFLWQEPAQDRLVAKNVEVVLRCEEPIGRVRHYPRGLTVARTQTGDRLSLLVRDLPDCSILVCEPR